jgi:transcription elongation factor Elf1
MECFGRNWIEFVEFKKLINKGKGKRMRLIKIKSQSRRDFIGLYECEGCGNEKEVSGYDDRNFHDNVAPTIKCSVCEESTNSLDVDKEYVPTKYPAGMKV